MRTSLQRIRGAIGMAVTWGAACSALGAIPRWVYGINTDAPLPLVFGVFGFSAGIVFSLLLALAERRRPFEQMSLPRFAAWGAAGGLLLSALFTRVVHLGSGDVLAVVPTFAAASALCAAGSLAIARRSARRALPDGRDEAVRAQRGIDRA